jgi:hypothetical protein
MKIQMLLFCLLGIFISAPTANTTAQKRTSPHTDSLLVHHFEKDTKLQWTRVYQLRLDEVQDLRMVIGFDGTYCNGWLEYPNTGQKATIKGSLQGQEMLLVELDHNLKPVATFEGTMEPKKLTGQRIGNQRKTAQKLDGQLVSQTQAAEAKLPCSDNKWYLKYNLKWANSDAVLTLARMQAGMVLGNLFVPRQTSYYTIKGKFLGGDKFVAHMTLMPERLYFGTIKGTLTQLSKLSLTVDQSGKPKAYVHCSLEEQLNLACEQQWIGTTSIDAVYPQTKNENLNKLLDERMKSWIQQIGELSKQRTDVQTASSWTELTCWQDDFICAVTTYHTSWDTTWHSSVVMYNLKKKKEVQLSDLLQERFDYKTWFQAQELKHLPGVEAYNRDKQYATWIDDYGYPVVYFNQSGLVLSTLFHPVYGTNEILITWANLKPYLRQGTPLKGLIQ